MSGVGTAEAPTGELRELDGEPGYHIAHLEGLAPFFMSVVSDSDLWLFLSSTGCLTAGRRDPDQALFPYTTDDRIHDSAEVTGGKTLLRVTRGGETALWEPLSERQAGRWRLERALWKGTLGHRVQLEEVNLDLGLTYRCQWATSERHGVVRRVELEAWGDAPVAVELLDGLQNVLPHGLDRRFQMEYSTLADGYKRTELLEDVGLALFRLSSIPVDKAEPCEALRVNVVWATGLEARTHLLSSAQLGAFRRGEGLRPEADVRGQRGAFFVHSGFALEPGTRRAWWVVADVGLDAAAVVALRQALRDTSERGCELDAAVADGGRNLRSLVASVDGLQVTADALSGARHYANALYNVMRGGLPLAGGEVSSADFITFLARSNRDLAASPLLQALPERLSRQELLRRSEATGDPDLVRLAHEYLPLTFSRRHGDPSRPWNIFSIRVKDEAGQRLLGYEGNWRDLFQNWEALAHSHPELVEGMIHKFLDASTLDGHNPYRVTREGFEWEVVDPHDAWSFIGYWGDHQVIYLLRLLEASCRFHPGALEALLRERRFTYADVPYRLASHREMLAHPRRTLTFDAEAHRRAMARKARLGADGLLVPGPDGPLRGTLLEKLLLVALARLWSYVPEGGIWMNTQRPEWNDANNALVGYGLSVVTLAHLRRYLGFLDQLLAELDTPAFEVAEALGHLFAQVHQGLVNHPPAPQDREAWRRDVMEVLGSAGTAYRSAVYEGPTPQRVTITREALRDFCRVSLGHLDHSLRANRRPDGLWHAYNLLQPTDAGPALRRLPEMLEGQAAVLGSGLLTPAEAADLLDALRASALYRADQGSYLLYPDRTLPRFLDRNRISTAAVDASPLLRTLVAEGDRTLVRTDLDGHHHFDAALRNAAAVEAALDRLAKGELGPLVEAERAQILALYEQTFDHQAFTGRSGTFYKYEGLGCIYWHMVSKLLLAVDEVRRTADSADGALGSRLEAHYRELRAGLGVHKSPTVHGAIPTEPYSHTPAFAGAQQPGMTGQVKEDLLSRLGELGVQVEDGRLGFQPWKVRREELLAEAAAFEGIDATGAPFRLELPAGSLGFTFCQVPVVLHGRGPAGLDVLWGDGRRTMVDGLWLDAASSAQVFARTGAIRQLEVRLGLDQSLG